MKKFIPLFFALLAATGLVHADDQDNLLPVDQAFRVEATAETRTVSVSSSERIGAPSVAPEAPAPRAASPDTADEAAPARPAFENLEDEMASLLGRPKNPT